jgi:hypothetical protein
MDFPYCTDCKKLTGHKRALAMGTFLESLITLGVSLEAIPFPPKRCIICGKESGPGLPITHTPTPPIPLRPFKQL